MNSFHLKGLLYVHNAVRRDAELFYKKVNSIESLSKKEVSTLYKWFENYIQMLDIHHSSEDNIFFPSLMKKSNEIKKIIIFLEDEHKELNEYIHKIKSLLSTRRKI